MSLLLSRLQRHCLQSTGLEQAARSPQPAETAGLSLSLSARLASSCMHVAAAVLVCTAAHQDGQACRQMPCHAMRGVGVVCASQEGMALCVVGMSARSVANDLWSAQACCHAQCMPACMLQARYGSCRTAHYMQLQPLMMCPASPSLSLSLFFNHGKCQAGLGWQAPR